MRLWGFIGVILLCVTVAGGSARAGEPAYIEAFFVPEQGFIRVNARFPMPGDLETAAFTLFPNAQVTSLWIPGLVAYEVDRAGTSTAVVVRMAPSQPGEILEISYEGFLLNYDLLPDKTLNRRLLWFPEFTGLDIGDCQIKITLPQAYVPRMNGTLVEERQGTFTTYTFRISGQAYPVVWFGDDEPVSEIEPEEEHEEPEQPPETPEVVDQPVEPPSPPALPVEEPEETVILPPELTDAVNHFAEALAARDRGALELLVSKDLPHRSQVLDYLLNHPGPDDAIAAQVVNAQMEFPRVLADTEFYYGETLLSKAVVVWSMESGDWLMRSFIQIPAEYEFLEQITDSALKQWATDLAKALAALDLAWLDHHMAGARIAVLSFLQQTHGLLEWIAAAVNEDRQRVVFLVQTESGSSLRLEFGYFRDGSAWKIKSFTAIPSADK